MAPTGESLRSTPRPSTGSQDVTAAGVVDVEIRRSKRHKTTTDNVSLGASTTCNISTGEEDTVHTLLTSVFSTLVPGYWWHVFPENNNNDGEHYDICLGTGQDWSKLLPLLIEGKILGLPKRHQNGIPYVIRTAALSNLCHAVSMSCGQRLESCRYKKSSSVIVRPANSYLCLGKPAFSTPEIQIKKNAKPNLVLREGMEFVNLSKRIASFCEKIKADALVRQSKESANNNGAPPAQGGAGGQDDSVDLPSETVQDDGEEANNKMAGNQAAPEALAAAAPVAARNTALMDRTEKQIQAALRLDLDKRPRLSRSGEKEILIHKRKQAGETERNRVLQIFYLWGYKAPDLTWKRRGRVAEAACRLVAYDCGFSQTLATVQVHSWDKSLVQSIVSGMNTLDAALAPKHAGTKSYVSQIDEACPGYLLELWRYAVKIKGSGVRYQDLADAMNEKSAAAPDTEQRPKVKISSRQLIDWVKANKGAIKKQSSSSTKKVNNDAHLLHQDETTAGELGTKNMDQN